MIKNCDDSLVIFHYEYKNNKNNNYEEEIIYDNIIDANPVPTSTIMKNMYLEMLIYEQNDKIIRQTEEYFCCPITHIKRCLFTCILNTLTDSTGYTSRVGIFDDHNDKTAGHDIGGCGYFFALIDGVLNIGIRNGVTDNGIDTLIPQTLFNCNTYDEGVWTQMYTYEIEYSAVGEVYFSINTGNGIILLHYYKNSDDRSPQVIRPNLPIRYEIFKTGTQNNIGEMRKFMSQICCTNKFHHCDKPYSCEKIIQQRGKLFIIPYLVKKGYTNLGSSSHGCDNSSRTSNHRYSKHSSHCANNHMTPNDYHTPSTRLHKNASCAHLTSTRCRHSSHTGHNKTINSTFNSSICPKMNCIYNHHAQKKKKTHKFKPLFSIRLKAKSNRECLKKFNILIKVKQKNIKFILGIIKNPIFYNAVTPVWKNIEGSCIEYDYNINSICQKNINIIYQTWLCEGGPSGLSKLEFNNIYNITDNFLAFTSNMSGEPHIYTFVAHRVDTSIPDIVTSLEWFE